MFKYALFLLVAVSAALAQQKCEEGEVTCPDGDCIPPSWICDGTADCSGGWDETPPCPTTTLAPCDGYQCMNGDCISSSWECDGYCDCDQCEDEPDVCPCNGFECQNGDCISDGWICDGWDDCSNGEDEVNCPTAGPCQGFECADGTCIIEDWQCDGYDDCDGGEDELDCPCEGDEIKCPGGIGCIPPEYICDTVADCPDESDEANCAKSSRRNMTAAQTSRLQAKHQQHKLMKLNPKKKQLLTKRAKVPERICKKSQRNSKQ